MPSRAERRRQSRAEKTGGWGLSALGGREVAAAVLLGVAVLLVAGGILLLSGDGDGEDGPTPSASGGPTFSPANEDEAAIEALARKSIEVLPRNQWPTLYDDFTAEFQARCPREEFVQAGITAAQEQAGNLTRLAYVRLEGVSVDGDTASATIVGAVTGEFEYKVLAAFQRVDGAWKLSPAAGTTGCQAFSRL